jgi:hypothetical protein
MMFGQVILFALMVTTPLVEPKSALYVPQDPSAQMEGGIHAKRVNTLPLQVLPSALSACQVPTLPRWGPHHQPVVLL